MESKAVFLQDIFVYNQCNKYKILNLWATLVIQA